MSDFRSTLREHALIPTALLVVCIFYGFAKLPNLQDTERQALVQQFRFEREVLPATIGLNRDQIRPVHQSFEHISSWISATGAAVALSDLDADGLANDLCLVDPRSNEALVAPVPGTGDRYAPFVLVTSPLHFDHLTMAPMGCLFGDFNEDGYGDILLYFWGRTPILFLRRSVEEPASETSLRRSAFAARELVPEQKLWNTNGMTRADVDGDGHLDLILTNYFADDAPVLGDGMEGRLEMQDSMSRAFNAGYNRIFLWNGAKIGSEPEAYFREAEGVLEEEVARGWTLAVGAADLDGDQLPEIFFANDFGPDRLLHNRSKPGRVELVLLEGVRDLTTPQSKVLGRDSFKGMGVDFGDLNSDGLLDIYVSNIAQEYSLEESHHVFLNTGKFADIERGRAPFKDHSEELGLSRSAFSWEARVADFNNDGSYETMQATGFVRGETDRWPELQELAMGNDDLLRDPRSWPRFQPGDDLSGRVHNPFFVRSSTGRFFDLAPEIGLGGPHLSRGIATADVDGDGDLDFALANQWEDSLFYRNEAPNPGAFLGLRLLIPVNEETETRWYRGQPRIEDRGWPAVGASARVRLKDGRTLLAQVDGGNGHSGARSPELHFGLGWIPAGDALGYGVEVDLEWRDRHGQTHGQTLKLKPGWHTVLLGSSSAESAAFGSAALESTALEPGVGGDLS